MHFRIESNLEDIILLILEECGLKNPHRGVDLRSHDFATIKALSRRFDVWIEDFSLVFKERKRGRCFCSALSFFSYLSSEYKRL